MAQLLDADYEEITSTSGSFSRYIYCIKQTVSILKKRYSTVFVQNPSIVLSALAVLLKPIFGYKLAIDAHNAGVRPKEGKNKLLQKFNLCILKGADVVIVTNQPLQQLLNDKGVTSCVMSDPLPTLKKAQSLDYSNFVFVVCSWAEDEPIGVYLDTAKQRPDINFVFSGNYKKRLKDKEISELPDNIILAGFVSEEEYVGLLKEALAVIDLTERDDCLVCGAYESISATQKVILSDTMVNKELFGNAAFYTKNSTSELMKSLDEALNTDITSQIENFKTQYDSQLSDAKSKVLAILQSG